MVCMVQPEIRQAVLRLIREESPLPTELIRRLSDKISYRDVQDALSQLIESGEVELASSLHLQIKRRAA
jgi:hypothetical protein